MQPKKKKRQSAMTAPQKMYCRWRGWGVGPVHEDPASATPLSHLVQEVLLRIEDARDRFLGAELRRHWAVQRAGKAGNIDLAVNEVGRGCERAFHIRAHKQQTPHLPTGRWASVPVDNRATQGALYADLHSSAGRAG